MSTRGSASSTWVVPSHGRPSMRWSRSRWEMHTGGRGPAFRGCARADGPARRRGTPGLPRVASIRPSCFRVSTSPDPSCCLPPMRMGSPRPSAVLPGVFEPLDPGPPPPWWALSRWAPCCSRSALPCCSSARRSACGSMWMQAETGSAPSGEPAGSPWMARGWWRRRRARAHPALRHRHAGPPDGPIPEGRAYRAGLPDPSRALRAGRTRRGVHVVVSPEDVEGFVAALVTEGARLASMDRVGQDDGEPHPRETHER